MVGVDGRSFMCLLKWIFRGKVKWLMDILLLGVHSCLLPCHVLVSRDPGVSRKVRFSE